MKITPSAMPDIRLRAAAVVPPTTLLAVSILMPSVNETPLLMAPLMSVPMKLPSMMLLPFFRMAMALLLYRLMTRPLITEFPPLTFKTPVTPPEKGPVLVPSISTIGRPAKPGCVVASMVSASVISGRADAGVIVCGPEPILKLIVSGPTFRFASIIACLNDPGPLSLVLLTRIGRDCGGEVSVNRLRLQPPVMVPLLPT